MVRALSELSGAISSRTTLPILGNVKLTNECEWLTIEATDLDLYVTSRIPTWDSKDGAVTLPAKRLLQLMREVPNESATMEIANDVATVTSGSSRFKLNGLPADEFPAMASGREGITFDIAANVLNHALRRVIYSTSTDESRYVLNGVKLEAGEGTLRFIASDGRRLAVAEIDGIQVEGIDAIIPNKAAQMVLKSVDAAEIVSVTIGDSWAEFVTAGMSLQTKLIEGNFPNWRQVMPREAVSVVSVDRESLLSAVRRVGVMVNEKTNAITMDFRDGEIELSANSPDVGEAKETITGSGDGQVKIAINPLFVQQCLASISAESVRIGLISESDPLTILESKFTAVLMPMRAS